MVDSSNHTTNLTILPFPEGDSELRRGKSDNIARSGRIFSSDNGIFATDTSYDPFACAIIFELDLDSFFHFFDRFVFDFSIDFDDVVLFVFVFWVLYFFR